MSENTMQVPAHIMARQQQRQATETKSAIMTAVISGDGFAFPKVSIRAGRYRLVEDGVETVVGVNLDVIVVGANPNISKVFYSKPFDGSLDVRPDCFSHDGVRPDSSVVTPISPSCGICPHNVLGSKVTPSGAKSKICGDQRHLAVVPAADPTKPYALTIAVSAMKNLREYFKELQNYGLSPEEVVTELGFDETVSFPKVTFKRKGFVSEKAIARVDAIVNSEEVKEVVRLVPPSLKAPALTAPVQMVLPIIEDEGEDLPVAPQLAKVEPVVAKVVKVSKPKVTLAEVQGNTTILGIDAIEKKLDDLFADD